MAHSVFEACSSASTKFLESTIASHDGFSDVFQSRWVVLCDDTRSLWACYANDVAPIDLEPLRPDIQTRRYYIHPDVDHIFGAHRSEGELVVHLGKLDHMPFRMIELNAIKVESVSWETYRAKVFNNGDLGSPMHPIGFKRLRDVKIRHIKRPRYTKKDFVYLINVVGYDGFRADLNNANPGVVLGRQVTEAAYLSILIGRYVAYDAAQLSEKFPGGEMEEKQHMLFMALVQVSFRTNIPKTRLIKLIAVRSKSLQERQYRCSDFYRRRRSILEEERAVVAWFGYCCKSLSH